MWLLFVFFHHWTIRRKCDEKQDCDGIDDMCHVWHVNGGSRAKDIGAKY